jgi:hypothetical protein
MPETRFWLRLSSMSVDRFFDPQQVWLADLHVDTMHYMAHKGVQLPSEAKMPPLLAL